MTWNGDQWKLSGGSGSDQFVFTDEIETADRHNGASESLLLKQVGTDVLAFTKSGEEGIDFSRSYAIHDGSISLKWMDNFTSGLTIDGTRDGYDGAGDDYVAAQLVGNHITALTGGSGNDTFYDAGLVFGSDYFWT
jgi:hypothetical protein